MSDDDTNKDEGEGLILDGEDWQKRLAKHAVFEAKLKALWEKQQAAKDAKPKREEPPAPPPGE